MLAISLWSQSVVIATIPSHTHPTDKSAEELFLPNNIKLALELNHNRTELTQYRLPISHLNSMSENR